MNNDYDAPFSVEEIDEQIDYATRRLSSRPPSAMPPPDWRLIEDMQRAYPAEDEEMADSLARVRRRLARSASEFSEGGPAQRRPSRSQPDYRPASGAIPPRRPPADRQGKRFPLRIVTIAAAVLLVVVVGGLVAGLVLVHHPANVTSHPTATPPGVAATPTPRPPQGVVYAVSNGNTVVALDAATGSTRWQQSFTLASGAELDIAAIEDQTVYVKTLVGYPSRGQDILTALNASDGTQVWQTHVDLDHGYTISGGVVFTLNSTTYVLSALDAHTGKSLWTFQPGTNLFSAFGEVVRGNMLYTEGYDSQSNGTLYAINISDGTERWHFRASGGVYSYFSLLTVTDDSLYVGSYIFSQPASAAQPPSTAVFSALNTSDGTERWHFQANQANNESWLSATVFNGVVYISASDVIAQPNSSGVLYALQASDGKALWQKQPVQEKSFFSSLTVSQGTVYIADNSGMYAFNGGSGQQMWYTTSGGSAHGFGQQPPVVQNGLVYMEWYGNSTTTQGNTTVFLSVLDASSGKERWHIVLFDGSGRDAPNIAAVPDQLVANGGVYILTYVATGAPGVQALRASDGKALWQNNTLTSLMVAAG